MFRREQSERQTKLYIQWTGTDRRVFEWRGRGCGSVLRRTRTRSTRRGVSNACTLGSPSC